MNFFAILYNITTAHLSFVLLFFFGVFTWGGVMESTLQRGRIVTEYTPSYSVKNRPALVGYLSTLTIYVSFYGGSLITLVV